MYWNLRRYLLLPCNNFCNKKAMILVLMPKDSYDKEPKIENRLLSGKLGKNLDFFVGMFENV